MAQHYLDQSATTKPSSAAIAAMTEAAEVWGNPSSVHALGQKSASLLRDCRAKIAKTLGLPRVSKDMVIFTASGTEANNIAMLGCAYSKKRDAEKPGTIVISQGEHPSIENPAQRLESQGYRVLRVPTLGGILDLVSVPRYDPRGIVTCLGIRKKRLGTSKHRISDRKLKALVKLAVRRSYDVKP